MTQRTDMEGKMEWRPISERPDFMSQPVRQFIVLHGERTHSGGTFGRIITGDALIDPNGPHGYRAEDIQRLMLICDMDVAHRVSHWMPYQLPVLTKAQGGAS